MLVMHEWALAEGVICTVNTIAEEQRLEDITEVTVKIGELQQVDHEILKFAIRQLRTSMMGNARFVLETVPARLTCRICGEKWKFNSGDLGKEKTEAIHFLPEIAHVYLRCPKCGSPDFEIAEGRGVWLESIKGRKKDG
jgi:hydrogenase nickel incorporation protein HypA/HybF